MKFIYFGSSTFSKKILEGAILKGLTPELIVTKPDKPSGRGLKLTSTEVSVFANTENITCIKPQSLKNKDIEQRLEEIDADLFVVADYGEIMPDSILSLPKIFSICLHPSLLPLYRGATPMEQAMIDGKNKTGVTIFKINAQVDAGDIIVQSNVSIKDNDNFYSLRERLACEGIDLLKDAIERIRNKKYKLVVQDVSKASFTYKLKKQDGKIIWNKKAAEVQNLIRAILEWPIAYTCYDGLMLKAIKAEIVKWQGADAPGTILNIDKSGICVAASQNAVKLKIIKPQGKREMEAFSFACGHKIKPGDRFE